MHLFRRAVFVVTALLAGVCGAQAQNAPSTVPLTLTQNDYGGGRIYLPAIFGNFMGTMRLDTGASATRVTLAPWNKDLPSLGQSDSTGASGKTVRCDEVEARNVQLKASQGTNIARGRFEVARCPVGDGDDLLGLDFFRSARFSLDFERRETTFFGETRGPSRFKPFRLLGPEQRLVGLDVRLGDAAATGLFDTGAEVSAVDRRFVEKHRNLFTPVKSKVKASEAGGGIFAPKIYKIKAIDVGDGRVLRGVYALVYDFGALRDALGPGTPVILGYNFISRFHWDLDFSSGKAPAWDAKPR